MTRLSQTLIGLIAELFLMYAFGQGCCMLKCSGSMIILSGGCRSEMRFSYPGMHKKKVKRVAPERYIHPIPPQLVSELPYFFKNKKPSAVKVWNENLKCWAGKSGLGKEGIVPKTTRKSIESWMYVAGLPMIFICLRQWHDSFTSMNHYQALPFTEAEKSEIERRLAGWV